MRAERSRASTKAGAEAGSPQAARSSAGFPVPRAAVTGLGPRHEPSGGALRLEHHADLLARCLTTGAPPAARPVAAGGATGKPTPLVSAALATSGRPLPGGLRKELEAGLGGDLGAIRVHDGDRADRAVRSVGALALASGSDIAFRSGLYAPGTSSGRALLVHEVVHTLQQSGGPPGMQLYTDPAPQAPPGSIRVTLDPSMVEDGTVTSDELLLGLVKQLFGAKSDEEAEAERSRRDLHWIGAPPVVTTEDIERGFILIQTQGTVASPAADTRGEHDGDHVGHWGAPFRSKLTAGKLIGGFDNPSAAHAAARGLGKPAVIYLEGGVYTAYELVVDSWFDFTLARTRVVASQTSVSVYTVSEVLQLVTTDGVVLEPWTETTHGMWMLDAGASLASTEDPLEGFLENHGAGLEAIQDRAELLRVFESAMRQVALTTLTTAEVEVERKNRELGRGRTDFGEPELIVQTARELSALDDRLGEVGETASLSRGGAGQQDHMSDATRRRLDAEQAARWERRRALEAQRRTVLARYPMLERIDNLDTFLAKSPEAQLEELQGTLPGVLRNIESTRKAVLSGALDLWKAPPVVDATLAGLGIEDEERRTWVKDEAASHEGWQLGIDLALAAFSIAFGIAAVVVSGPFGVALAAGALGVSTVDALRVTNRTILGTAAADTALDRNDSLIPMDLTWAWVAPALAWAGVLLDAASLLKVLDALKDGAKLADAVVGAEKTLDAATLARLKRAEELFGKGAVVTAESLPHVARQLGVPVKLVDDFAGEVHVFPRGIPPTGAFGDVVVRVGANTPVADVLLHLRTVRSIRRYRGVAGALRSLRDRLLSSMGLPLGAKVNPFEEGTEAFAAFEEVGKLEDIILLRRSTLKDGAIDAATRGDIEAEIRFLDSEVAHFGEIVAEGSRNVGPDFIAKLAKVNGEAARKAGYPSLDLLASLKKADGTALNPADYYYVRKASASGDEFSVRRYRGRGDTPSVTPNKSTQDFSLGKLSREDAMAKLLAEWPAATQKAFADAEKAAAKEYGARVFRVVPLEGVAQTTETLGSVLQRAEKLEEFEALLVRAAAESGNPAVTSAALDDLLKHRISLVRGTDALRAFGYRKNWLKVSGLSALPNLTDLHHLVPLYLGGGNTARLLAALPDAIHDEVHALFALLKLGDGTALAPHAITAALKEKLVPAAGVILDDGSVVLVPLKSG